MKNCKIQCLLIFSTFPTSHIIAMFLQCAVAKSGFEKNKVSLGFEALARAQYLLKSKISLGNMPLLAQACILMSLYSLLTNA